MVLLVLVREVYKPPKVGTFCPRFSFQGLGMAAQHGPQIGCWFFFCVVKMIAYNWLISTIASHLFEIVGRQQMEKESQPRERERERERESNY